MQLPRPGRTRREFLRAAAAGLAWACPVGPAHAGAGDDFDLVVVSGEPAAATRRALDALGGMARFVRKGQRVVLKPNMSFTNPPEKGTTTHPAVVATVARACMEAGAERVVVLDYPLRPAQLCLERSGIKDACRGIAGVHVLALEERKFFRPAAVPGGKVLQRLEVFQDVLEAQVLINLPQAKSHSTTGVSLGIKNLMGLIWDRWSFHSRHNINEALADLAAALRPHLTLLDATRALVDNGPGGPGTVQNPNLVIAGTDPVAVDAYGVGVAPWYGRSFRARQVEHILAAHQRGLGRIDVEQMRIRRETA
ncbi:MAG TPA: DUF362 domain-containing protein [Candidatus Methylomirabilis sp.]